MSQINWNIEFNTRARRIVCWVAGAVLLAAGLFVWLVVDERLNCYVDNAMHGHVWQRDFARERAGIALSRANEGSAVS